MRNSSWSNSTRTSLAVARALTEVAGLDVERRRRGRSSDISRLWNTRSLRLAQVLALLGRQLVEVLEDPFEVAVGGDQLRRRLLADARDAREVVARVAAQRGVLGVLPGGDAGALDDAGFVVERVVGDAALVVEHLDVRVFDELVGVAVAGDDDDVDARRRRRGWRAWRSRRRPRRPSISSIGMRSASSTSRISGSCGANRSGVSLRPALYSASSSSRNVRPGRVERHRDVVGLLVGEHLHEHRREPVHRVGDRAVGVARSVGSA